MVNMTLSLPEELIKRMKKFREVKWSEVARQAIEKRVSEFEAVEAIASKSTFMERDAKEIAKMINHSVANKLSSKK